MDQLARLSVVLAAIDSATVDAVGSVAGSVAAEADLVAHLGLMVLLVADVGLEVDSDIKAEGEDLVVPEVRMARLAVRRHQMHRLALEVGEEVTAAVLATVEVVIAEVVIAEVVIVALVVTADSIEADMTVAMVGMTGGAVVVAADMTEMVLRETVGTV